LTYSSTDSISWLKFLRNVAVQMAVTGRNSPSSGLPKVSPFILPPPPPIFPKEGLVSDQVAITAQETTSNFAPGDATRSDSIPKTPTELAGSLPASLSRKRIHEEDESNSTLSAKRTRNDSVVVASASKDNQLGSATASLVENDDESCAVKGSQAVQAMRTLSPPPASTALSIPPPPVPPSTVVRSRMSNDSSENLHFSSAAITSDHFPSSAPSSMPVIPPPPVPPSMPSSEVIVPESKKALPLHRRREEIVQIFRGLPQSGSLSFTVSIADEEYARLQKWTRRWEAPGYAPMKYSQLNKHPLICCVFLGKPMKRCVFLLKCMRMMIVGARMRKIHPDYRGQPGARYMYESLVLIRQTLKISI
jgi:hypothetical protein